MEYLSDIKNKFDNSIRVLDLFFPLIETMYDSSGALHINHELFAGSLKNIDYQFRLHSTVPIDKVISEALLYLDPGLLQRFHRYSRREFSNRRTSLDHFRDTRGRINGEGNHNNHRKFNAKEIRMIDEIFLHNCSTGPYSSPLKGSSTGMASPNDLLAGIGSYFDYFGKKIEELSAANPVPDNPGVKKEAVQRKEEFRPVFRAEKAEELYNLIRDYFSREDQALLKKVITTGRLPARKLVFGGSGKTLLDFFKQLIEGHFLTVASQRDFEIWVSGAFEFMHNGSRKEITPKYAGKIVSGGERPARGNKLINVKAVNGKFEIEELKLEKREQ